MTACVNKKHSRRVAAAVSASLVGALTLGAAPAVVMAAEEAPVEQQFADPEGAFSNAKVVTASFDHLGSRFPVKDTDGDGVYTTEFQKNKPVVLNEFTVKMIGGAEAGKTLTIPSNDSDYRIEYFTRGADGKPSGDAIKTDISAAGKYIVKITAVDGHYKDGVVYLPFDIEARKLDDKVMVDGNNYATYNAEVHTFKFFVDNDSNGYYSNGDEKLYEGTDYTVYYVLDETDASEDSKVDVKNVGTYRAVIKGMGDYAGTVELSQDIVINPLDLATAPIEGVVSTSDHRPENPFYIWIDGVRYGEGSAIMGELKSEFVSSNTGDSMWFDGGEYTYKVSSKIGTTDPNIKNDKTYKAYKVGTEVSFLYGGEALPESVDIYKNDPKTGWDANAVTGFAADGTMDGAEVDKTRIVQTVYNVNGGDVTGTNWQDVAGKYTIVIKYAPSDGSIGGIASVDVNVYEEAVNADAQAAVLYDADGDNAKDVVTSIEKVYDGINTLHQLEVVVEDAAGNELTEGIDYDVTYVNAEGKEVGDVTNAGTYTLKISSDWYKLSGTTELTITISKLDMSTVKAGAVTTETWDNVGSATEYLPWQADGVTLDELVLQYKDGDRWVKFPMSMVKATILDSEGKELNVIEDEGVYTIHFEARNDDAENNYTVPADFTVTCIKDGKVADKDGNKVNHLKFSDVRWNDYFADPVDWISGKGIMFGYKAGRVFGALDNLSRGQVACVLYNMASVAGRVNETDLVYSELHGYDTGFSDVNGKAYYAKAIAWAAQAGVVNGYADGTFHADQAVTRQEFACMLANYAKAYGTYEAAGSDALDEMSDAEQVADFAKDSVAWAVENGIIGNSGYVAAGSTIIRADAACMVYNYAK